MYILVESGDAFLCIENCDGFLCSGCEAGTID